VANSLLNLPFNSWGVKTTSGFPFLNIKRAPHSTTKTRAVAFALMSKRPAHFYMPAGKETVDEVSNRIQRCFNVKRLSARN
jgi:hypothetical protein